MRSSLLLSRVLILPTMASAFSVGSDSTSSVDSPNTASSSSSNPTPPRRFYIIRHGETDANASGIIQGSSDISRLTARGRGQAATMSSSALCPIATDGTIHRIATIYVSPLTRARETLSIMRQSAPEHMLPPAGSEVVLHNLREIDFYSWENTSKVELREQHPDAYAAWKAGDPDGLIVDGRRPLWETWDRAAQVWDEIRSASSALVGAENGTDGPNTAQGDGIDSDETTATLLVCHGTLGQALLGSAFGLDATIFRKNEFPNCGMAEVLWHAEDDVASAWRWHYPQPTAHGCLREQLLGVVATSKSLL